MSNTAATSVQDKDVIIEWAPYIVKQGISEEELLHASSAIQSHFLEKQKGYIKRELLKGKDDQWVDLVYWASIEDAERAAQDVLQSPVCLTYFGMMVEVDYTDPGAGIFHYIQKAIWSNVLE